MVPKGTIASIPLASLAVALMWSGCAVDELRLSDEPLFLNELMAKNTAAVPDDHGEFDDWFEIFNDTGEDVDLGGYYVGDDASDICRAQIPDGVVVPSGGVVVLWADGTPEQGLHHLPFRLSAGGEELTLTDSTCALIDIIEFTEMTDDEVVARFPDGAGDPTRCTVATPEELNGASCE